MMKNIDNGLDNFLLHLKGVFSITVEDSRDIIKAFHQEMKKGLAGTNSSLKMIPSFVGPPKGTEKGSYIAVDLGGTNIRIIAVELDGKGNIVVPAVIRHVIPNDMMCGTGEALFDHIAEYIRQFFEKHHISGQKTYDLAFTFSFPIEQHSIVSGILIGWTKNFTASGVVGRDVVAMLSEALKRKNMEFINVVALSNDTVGTFMARRYSDSSCDMGVIIGTGTNACYPEKADRILKYHNTGTFGEIIINMEWGGFAKLKMNVYDQALDQASDNNGMQHLEKMVSGMYLGEIARHVFVDMIKNGLLFDGSNLPVFSEKYMLRTEHLSLIAQGSDFFAEFGITDVKEKDKKTIREVCRIVSTRSARIAGTAIAAVITWMDTSLERNHTVAIDGALFEKYPGYRDCITDMLQELFGKKAKRIRIELVRDGSGIGSAVVGAVTASS
ncbi:MAG TPA: hypothetical protein PLA06_08545 [Syntrophorhabdaceae bacterium]|nr:hypothetical protein [Syntrophorhabdaceae bacterium]